jgi:hypothetical protein
VVISQKKSISNLADTYQVNQIGLAHHTTPATLRNPGLLD